MFLHKVTKFFRASEPDTRNKLTYTIHSLSPKVVIRNQNKQQVGVFEGKVHH